MEPKVTLEKIDQFEDRCRALSFFCKNPEECSYEYDREDRTTTRCPNCDYPRQVCANYPVKGRTRCSFHGGKTPMGIAHASYKGRSLSADIPTRLLERWQLEQRSIQTGEILEMSDDIALLNVRKADLLSRLDTKTSSDLWESAQKTFEKFNKAKRKAANGSARAAQEMAEHLDTLQRLLVRGYTDSLVWVEISNVMEQQRRLRESELKRKKEASQIVTEEDVATMIGFILDRIRERVKDQDIRAALLNDFQALQI